MKSILFACLALFIFSCMSAKDSSVNENSSKAASEENMTIHIKAAIGRVEQASDPLSINSVSVKGNKLIVDVSYSGGCKEHFFQLIGSPSLSKSLPPIRSIQLVHDAKGDLCKMNMTKTIEIEISELAYKKENGNKIHLSLSGWNQQIDYFYEK